MSANKVRKEYDNFKELFKSAGADDLKILICDSLILECARARIQLEDLNSIVEKTGLVKIHPDSPETQKSLPIATELTKVRASLTNMLTKLDKMLCTNVEEDFYDLDEFE